MSVLATPLPHQPFSDTELFASSNGSVSAHTELLPVPPHIALPIPVPLQATPFPKFQQRHTSPYPMPHQQTSSALGPAQADAVPTDDNTSHVEPPPPAPSDSMMTLPDLTPDIRPQTPLPPTANPSPPRGKVLGPTMMIKLAPPADDHSYHQRDVPGIEAEPSNAHSRESSGSTTITPRQSPTLPVDKESFDPYPLHRTPSLELHTPSGTLSQDMVLSPSPPNPKPHRPKSMGPPPRPRRSQTVNPHPHGPVSVRMVESLSADSRERKLRANNILRASSYSQVGRGSPGPSRALSDAGPGSVTPSAINASDLSLPDLGGESCTTRVSRCWQNVIDFEIHHSHILCYSPARYDRFISPYPQACALWCKGQTSNLGHRWTRTLPFYGPHLLQRSTRVCVGV